MLPVCPDRRLALGDALGFKLSTPWKKLTKKQQEAVLYGHDTEVHVRYRNRYGRERSYYTAYEGVIPFIERRHAESESDTSRERYEGYMREVPCPECNGSRLKPEVLAVTLADKSIADIGWWEDDGSDGRRLLFTLHGREGSVRYALIDTGEAWLLHLTKDQPA